MATFLALTTYIPFHVQVGGYEIGAFHIVCALSLIYYLTIGVGAAVLVRLFRLSWRLSSCWGHLPGTGSSGITSLPK